MAVAGTLEYLISIDSSKVSSGLNAAEGKVKGFGNKLSAWTVAKGQMLGGLVTKAGQTAVKFVSSSIEESKAFDKSMSQVAATLGKSTKEIQNLSKFAREMGSKTAFTATEAAEGLNYMALAGYDAEKSMRMLPTVLNLAAAGTMELGAASDMVTDAQSALGLSIEETEVMVDQMAKTSSKTNTSVEQLGSAFLTVGGTAKKLKGGTAELSALLGVLANNGIKGAEGGTALRNVLNALSNPAGKAAKQLKRLKIDAYDKEGNLRSMTDILSEFGEKTKDMSDKKRTDLFAKMFNVRDLKSVEALLSMTREDWEELTGEIEDSAGAADKMAKTQLDNLAGDMTIFGSALSEAKLALVEGLTPALRSLVKGGTYWLTDLTKNFKEKGLAGAIETARKAFDFFSRKMTRSKNPVVKFLGESLRAFRQGFTWSAFGGVITKGWNLIKQGAANLGGLIFGKNEKGEVNWPTWKDVQEAAEQKWQEIKDGAKELGGLIFGNNPDGSIKWPTWNDVRAKAVEAWNTIRSGAKQLGGLIFGNNPDGSIKWPTWSDVRAKAVAAWNTIRSGAKKLGGLIFGDNQVGISQLTNITTLFETISSKWKEMRETIINNAINIATYFFDTSDPDTVSTAIKTVADALEAIGVAIVTYKLVTSLPTVFNTIKSLFATDLTGGSKIGLILAGIAAGVVLIYEHWDEIKPELQRLGTWLNDNVLAPINEFIDGLKNAIKEIGAFFGIDTSGWFGGNRPTPTPNNGNNQPKGLHGAPLDKEQAESLAAFRKNYLDNPNATGVNGKGQKVSAKEAYEEAFKTTLRESGFEEPAINSLFERSLKDNKEFAGVLTDLSNASPSNPKQYPDQGKITNEPLGGNKRRGVDPHKAIEAAAEAAKNAEKAEGNYNTTLGKTGEIGEKSTKRVKDGVDKSKESLDKAGESVAAYSEGLAGIPKFITTVITTIFRTIGGGGGSGLRKGGGNESNIPDFEEYGDLFPHAKGEPTVPYDNYIAQLHRGEMVLTKSQARQYREGNSGNIDIAGLAASIVGAIKEGMANATVNSYLDGKGVTRRVNRRNENRDKARRFVTA